jgi:hypothetical protein
MKKIAFIVLIIFTFSISCQTNKKQEKEENTFSTAIEDMKAISKERKIDYKNSDKETFKALKKITPISSKELLPFLPEVINGNKKTNKYAYPGSGQMATGGYGPLNSQYNFSIEDGAGSKAILKNFFNTYSQNLIGSKGNEYVYKERAGYKTIAFLQPKISRNQISFIYNNRFRITLEGSDDVDALWSYIDFENLKKLDQYN